MIQPQFSLVLAVYAGLLLGGVLYNLAVQWAERKGYLEGFTWLAVTTGVLFTLAGLAVINWRFALIGLGAFAASGSPMAAGAVWRYVKARESDQANVRQTPTLAE